jgi:pimeloyl-ACP methyl ester carboxylesterase
MASASDAVVRGSEIFFASHNPAATTTIVLLHALFASHREWDHVVPHLSDFHLIVPDLPQHSRSHHVGPFTLQLAAAEVAQLIRNHARGGVAHVVGVSLGGFVALELIRRHPETVASAFVSGSSPFTDQQLWIAQRPNLVHWGLWVVMGSGIYRLQAWLAGLVEHGDLQAEMRSNNSYELANSAFFEMSTWQADAARAVAKQDRRVLVAAGENGDPRDKARELAHTLQEGGRGEGKQTRVYLVKDAIHTWDLQFPELFGTAIKAWIGKQPLPAEFKGL